MKKTISLLLALILCLSLAACGGMSKEETALLETTWVNINDGDVYTFTEDGSGTHDSISITYTVDGTTVNIAEGAGNLSAVPFTLDLESSVQKLIPADGSFFYVRDTDYETVAEQVRQETLNILTSCDFWAAVMGGTTNYISFTESGGGFFLLPGWTLNSTWEYIDNNTIKVHVDWNGGQVITLDVVNNNGNMQLVNAKTGVVTYVPKQ